MFWLASERGRKWWWDSCGCSHWYFGRFFFFLAVSAFAAAAAVFMRSTFTKWNDVFSVHAVFRLFGWVVAAMASGMWGLYAMSVKGFGVK